MTQRERQASAGLSATVPAPHAPGGSVALAAPRHDPAPPAPEPPAPRATLWEDAFHAASPAQQHELLSLARSQGLLYAHQLPAAGNGARPHPADEARGLQLLSQLLQGQAGNLAPARPEPVEPFDAALDGPQRQAVARAVAAPDLCLIQGLPGTGKSRVVAEIVRQAAARGERALLIAPGPAALDRVLELVGAADELCAVRCLGRDER